MNIGRNSGIYRDMNIGRNSYMNSDTNSFKMTLLEWLESGPFTLVMSSGFFGFYAHCGVLQALESAGLRPAAVAGSSAGALVVGCWAAGLSAGELEEELLRLRREDFWDPAPGLGFLRGRAFRKRLQTILPAKRFDECRVPAVMSVFDLFRLKTRVLSSGDLPRAIHASCAVPLMFHPVSVDGGLCVDGGVSDRPGIAGVHEEARVFFHHLASRSPWRLRPPAIPCRAELIPLVINGLPRVHPFHLERGADALRVARKETLKALHRPMMRSFSC